jgi:hypothetical protein
VTFLLNIHYQAKYWIACFIILILRTFIYRYYCIHFLKCIWDLTSYKYISYNQMMSSL